MSGCARVGTRNCLRASLAPMSSSTSPGRLRRIRPRRWLSRLIWSQDLVHHLAGEDVTLTEPAELDEPLLDLAFLVPRGARYNPAVGPRPAQRRPQVPLLQPLVHDEAPAQFRHQLLQPPQLRTRRIQAHPRQALDLAYQPAEFGMLSRQHGNRVFHALSLPG